MDRFRASVEAARRGEEPPEDGYHGDYVAELAKEEGDPVPAMRKKIEDSLERFRIHIDSWANQSEIEQRVAELLPRLDTYEADGTLYARTTAHGDDKDRSADPLVRRVVPLLRRRRRVREGQVRARLRHRDLRAGRRSSRLRRAAQGGGGDARLRPESRRGAAVPARASDSRGGEQTKMSKRRGDVVFLDDFIDEIGVDAARWYLVNRGPDQTIEIDVDLAAEKSQKNPVYYVQYAHARIAGILRNAGDAEMSPEPGAARAGGARADQAACRAARRRRRRCREARPAGDPDVRDPRRRRLPPLLPRASRARERAAGVPARALAAPRSP